MHKRDANLIYPTQLPVTTPRPIRGSEFLCSESLRHSTLLLQPAAPRPPHCLPQELRPNPRSHRLSQHPNTRPHSPRLHRPSGLALAVYPCLASRAYPRTDSVTPKPYTPFAPLARPWHATWHRTGSRKEAEGILAQGLQQYRVSTRACVHVSMRARPSNITIRVWFCLCVSMSLSLSLRACVSVCVRANCLSLGSFIVCDAA